MGGADMTTPEGILDFIAELTWDDVDDIVPAGGSSRMPMVTAMLRRLSGKAPARGLDPDTCVAVGAAQCAILRHQSDHPAVGRWRAAPPPI